MDGIRAKVPTDAWLRSGEQIRREHGIAIPATLATLDPDQQALAVDIGDLGRRDLGHAQPSVIGD
jgi:hypothetical protein